MKRLTTILALILLPSVAYAHPAEFHISPFQSGLLHPLTGLDHLLAMLAVGLWAAQRGGKALWIWPTAFVAVMLLGGMMGMNGVTLPLLEPGIAASVLILGLLIAGAAKLPVWFGATAIAAFALFHGNAHGLEATQSGTALYATGFALSTALLHVIGLGAGTILFTQKHQLVLRLCGGLVAAFGASFLFA